MLRLAKDFVQLVVDDVKADFLLPENHYHLLSLDREARIQLLESLGLESVLIDNMGTELEPNLRYVNEIREVIPPVIDYSREVGYHHKLDGS